LEAVLKPSGGMVLMVYAPHGRVGVYAMQDIAKILVNSSSKERLSPEVMGAVRNVLDVLPPEHLLSNYRKDFRSNDYFDTNIVDDFLHAQDRAYTVTELDDFVRSAGLRITAFAFPFMYEPLEFGFEQPLLDLLQPMTWLQRAQFAEHFVASYKKHVVYVVKSSNDMNRPVQNISLDMVPVLRVGCMPGEASKLLPIRDVTMQLHKLNFRFHLAPLHKVFLAKFDGHHTFSEVISFTANATSELAKTVQAQVEQTMQVLLKMNKMVILVDKLPNRLTPLNEGGQKCNWKVASFT